MAEGKGVEPCGRCWCPSGVHRGRRPGRREGVDHPIVWLVKV